MSPSTRDGVSQQQSDFSSLIAKIPRDTQIVYIPWQLPPKGKAFGQQMRSAGKGSIKLMGSDGLFDPRSPRSADVYASFFPIEREVAPDRQGVQEGARRRREFFGAPSYVAAQVVGERDRPGVQGRQGHPRRGSRAGPARRT